MSFFLLIFIIAATGIEKAHTPELLIPGWALETVVPPCPIISAPFDVAIMPDGRLITAGPNGMMVVIHQDGTVEPTSIPYRGSNFEASNDGSIWFYDFTNGAISVVRPGKRRAETVAHLPPSYCDASIAVAPDGRAVYIVWMQGRRSVLYRWTTKGVRRIVEGTERRQFRAVEVTSNGRVYVGASDGVFRLDDDLLVPYGKFRDLWISSDSMTSDSDGNLYFAAQGNKNERGIYQVFSGGKVKRFADLGNLEIPLGMAYDNRRKALFAAQKETQGIIEIRRGNIRKVVKTSGLTTPIAIAFSPDGELYINGDESGVMRVAEDGMVTRFRGGIPSYQPPAADMVFGASGILYYTCACPGFQSSIITIDADGKVHDLTKDTGCPAGIDVDSEGRIFYADYERCAIYELEPDGKSLPIVKDVPYPVGLVVTSPGTFWVSAAAPGASGDPHVVEEIPRTRILRFVVNAESLAGAHPEHLVLRVATVHLSALHGL